jgi:hypothetical protein
VNKLRGSAVPDPFTSPKRRLRRAQRNLASFDRRVAAYIKSNPCVYVIEPDASGQREFHKVRFTKIVPDSMGDLATEIIEALRSAIDQASYVCCRARHGERRHSTHFPMAETAAEVDTALAKGASKYVPPEIAALFRTFRPYSPDHGGNFALWTLNRLCNQGKHRVLVPVDVTTNQFAIEGTAMAGIALPMEPWDRRKNEYTIIICDAGVKPQFNLDLRFSVGFGEIDPAVEPWPADALLRLIGNEVSRIVAETEIEARRIGLV